MGFFVKYFPWGFICKKTRMFMVFLIFPVLEKKGRATDL